MYSPGMMEENHNKRVRIIDVRAKVLTLDVPNNEC
jgi:hypothetical protein